MNAKELIKEIDPDYHKCYRCKRYFHIDKLVPHMDFMEPIRYVCSNRKDCLEYKWVDGKYQRIQDEKECPESYQRDRSRLQ